MTPRRPADRTGDRRDKRKLEDGFKRETFTLSGWRQLGDGRIDFTMQRLLTAD